MGIVKLLEYTSGAEGGAGKRVCEVRIRIEALCGGCANTILTHLG